LRATVGSVTASRELPTRITVGFASSLCGFSPIRFLMNRSQYASLVPLSWISSSRTTTTNTALVPSRKNSCPA
jgi:hypothetical protein